MIIFRTAIVLLLGILPVTGLASDVRPWQMGFQEAVTPVMRDLVSLHDFMMIVMFGVVVVVFFLLLYVIFRFNAKSNPVPNRFSHNVLIEVIWTVIPVIILVVLFIPSIKVLRRAETIPADVDFTVKVVGYQWYWHYSYPDQGGFEFDSYLIPEAELKPGQKRLLEVDNRIVIPVNKVVRFLITAADVIHSFAVPAFGIKTDAIPGRINETWVKVDKVGVYYGQCSELCGVNHGFMPIAVEVVEQEEFDHWIKQARLRFASANTKVISFAN